MRNLTLASILIVAASPAMAVTTSQSTNAMALAQSLAGAGVTATSASLVTNTENGFFTNGAAATGISQGVVLTTGTLGCIGSANTSDFCGAGGNGASVPTPQDSANLSFSFTATSTNLFFNYVFGSEEYNEFVGSNFNDSFALTLTGLNYAGGVNLAQLPGGGGPVTINNVNGTTNSAFYRNNRGTGSLDLPIELDGLTTVLTASATNLVIGSTYSLSFFIQDVGDNGYDSAVFIQANSVGVVNPPAPGGVPEPATWATMMVGFGLLGGALRRNRRTTAATA